MAEAGEVISIEDWAEIRRLHRGEAVPIKEIARRLGISRNTVRRALRGSEPPSRTRAPRQLLVSSYEPAIRALLADWPRMPSTVIAQRIGRPYSATTLKDRLRAIRPEYLGTDPVDRTEYDPGDIAQCDLWFPAVKIPVGDGTSRILPVLVMALGYSRTLGAVMIPTRQAGDILAGMWQLINGWGRCPKTLVWDREAIQIGLGTYTVATGAKL